MDRGGGRAAGHGISITDIPGGGGTARHKVFEPNERVLRFGMHRNMIGAALIRWRDCAGGLLPGRHGAGPDPAGDEPAARV